MKVRNLKSYVKSSTLLLFLALQLPSVCFAQQYTIESSTGGGGGTSAGGRFTVEGTIGQPDAGTSSSGRYQIDGGFWSGVQVVQVASLPQLRISRAGDSMVISWEDAGNRFTLQESKSLRASEWSMTKRKIHSDGATRFVEITDFKGHLFFRPSKK